MVTMTLRVRLEPGYDLLYVKEHLAMALEAFGPSHVALAQSSTVQSHAISFVLCVDAPQKQLPAIREYMTRYLQRYPDMRMFGIYVQTNKEGEYGRNL